MGLIVFLSRELSWTKLNHRTVSVSVVAIRASALCKGILLLSRLGTPRLTGHNHSCAAINGIDGAIVARANEIALLAAQGENLVAACATLSADEMQALQEAVCNDPPGGGGAYFVGHITEALTFVARIRWLELSFKAISQIRRGPGVTRKRHWIDYLVPGAKIGPVKPNFP